MVVTEDTIIGDILDHDRGCTEIFASMGMQCTGCPASRGETVGEACQVHGVDPQELLALLGKRLQSIEK